MSSVAETGYMDEDPKTLKIAFVVVRSVVLFLTVVGIAIKINQAIVERTAKEVTGSVRSSSVIKTALGRLKEAFTTGDDGDKIMPLLASSKPFLMRTSS